jgi:hypothetical protein
MMADKNETERPAANAVGKPKRRWLRRLIVVLCLLLVGLVVLVVLAPTLISTGAGKRFVMGTVSDQVAGEVDADGLSVGWGGGQSLLGVVIRDATGGEVARIGRVDLPDVSLLALLRGGLGLGELRIERVTGDIVGYDDGTTNLQRALAPPIGKSSSTTTTGPKDTTATGWPDGLSLAITLHDFDVSYRADSVDEPIRLVIPEAALSANDPTHLVMKFNAELSRAQSTGSINAEAKIDQLFDAGGAYQPGNATAHVDGVLADLPIELFDALMQKDGGLVALLGPVLNGHILAEVTTAGGNATIKADSEHLHINTQLAFDDAGLNRDGESAIRFTLTPDGWAALTAVDGDAASTLAGPVDIAVELRGLSLPFGDDGLNLAGMSLDLGMAIGDARMLIDGVGEVTLESTTGSVQTSQLGESLTARFNTTSGLNNKPGGVALDIELAGLINTENHFDTAHTSAKVNGQITNAPIAAILDELLPGVTQGLATRTLGPAMDATVNFNTAPRSDGDGMAGGFEVDVLTEGGEAGLNATLIGSFDYDEQAVHARLADGSYARFTLTQALIEAYQEAFGDADTTGGAANASTATLGAPASLRLDLTRAVAVMNAKPDGGYQLDPASLQLTGKLASPEVRVHQGGQYAATLKNMLVDIANTGLSGDTRFAINAQIDYATKPGEEPKPGLIKSNTTITGLAREDGKLTFAKASYTTDTLVRQAPIDLIDAVLGMGGDLTGSVGPRALLNVSGAYSPSEEGTTGGLDLLLKSRSSSADMKLLVEDGRWVLKNDAPLSFRVTPRLSQTVLKKVNPFLGGAVSAKLPIGVTVKREGFSLPLTNMALKDINANMTLELGELDLRGEGDFKQVLDALGVGKRSLLNASFTPVTISLADGQLSYQDLVMVIDDDIRLGFSGKVDLNSRGLDLRMMIPGSSLSRISWLKGTISPDHVIVIPLTGTFDEPKLDVKLLTGEIAKAAVRGQLEGVAGDAIGDKIGGEAGVLVGGLLNEILTGKKPADGAEGTADVSAQESGETPTRPEAGTATPSEKVETPLTDAERQARKERRRARRERLEREQAEREAQEQQQQ